MSAADTPKCTDRGEDSHLPIRAASKWQLIPFCKTARHEQAIETIRETVASEIATAPSTFLVSH